MMEEEQARQSRENIAALIVGMGICAAVAGYVVLHIWGLSACSGAKVHSKLLEASNLGCTEYWLERYQTLFTGVLSAMIAVGAAFLVLRTLARMDQQNRVAEASLEQAKLQFLRAELRAEAVAGQTARSIAASISYTLLPVFTQMREKTKTEIMEALHERIPRIEELMAEFRKSVAPYLRTPQEIELYRLTEDRIDASAIYVAAHLGGYDFKEIANTFATANELTDDHFSPFTALLRASDDLHAIAKRLQERRIEQRH
jgi:hypothetical protein